MPDDSPHLLAIVNARVWTNDPRRPWTDAVLVHEKRIFAVGSSAELRKRAGAKATVIDASGRLVVPDPPDARLAPGAAASLAIIERPAGADPAEAAPERDIVFSLLDGRVVVDRRGTSP